MNRVITIIVLAVFIPMQLYAAAAPFQGFGTDTAVEYFVPRPPEKLPEQPDQKLSEKILEEPPKADVEKSGPNWWLWGGLAVIAGGVAALAGGGGGGGSKSGGEPVGGGPTTTTVTGSW